MKSYFCQKYNKLTDIFTQITKAFCQLCMITLIMGSVSCSVTRHLEKDETLLVKNKISIKKAPKISGSEIENYLQQPPNRKTLGILFHLRVYNTFKNSDGRFGTWIRETIGEEPVIYDSTANAKTIQQFIIYLKEQGYYYPKIQHDIKPKGIHNKKIKVSYNIDPGTPYIINTIEYEIPDSNIARLVDIFSKESQIKKGNIFNIQTMLEERQTLTRHIQNHGYYSFTTNDIYFTADTAQDNYTVNIAIGIKPYTKNESQLYPQYKIRKTIIYPDFSLKKTESYTESYTQNDTIIFKYKDSLYVSPNVISRSLYIKNNELYNINDIEKTHKSLIVNKLFKNITISFNPVETEDTSTYVYIDCIIKINPVTQQAFTIEIEGTNTGGDWGAETNISYNHKNIFKGAEFFQIKLSAAAERNVSFDIENETALFNTQEYGIETRLDFPLFLSPIKPQKFDKKYRPSTTFLIQYNYNRSSYFTRPTSHFSYGYTWFGNNYLTHNFNPVDISYINYYDRSVKFRAFIASKDYYKYSYEDYLIYSSNYSFVFYNKNPQSLRDYYYLKFYVESSGNAMYGIHKLINNELDKFETFNVTFAQYFKTEADFRYYHNINSDILIASRIFGGVTVPYLNSDWVPSIKRYYVGGANSMRGWATHTLGPGSHKDSTSTLQYNLGDIKLEANLESRFNLFWILEGAVFLDIGNVWAFNNNEIEGAEFMLTNFWNELAVSTGFGIRFDLSFLIFRTDFGVKFREPYEIDGTNSHIIWGNREMKSEDYNFSIGIGYPF
jgi:outer membrane protein assembly factor BamA